MSREVFEACGDTAELLESGKQTTDSPLGRSRLLGRSRRNGFRLRSETDFLDPRRKAKRESRQPAAPYGRDHIFNPIVVAAITLLNLVRTLQFDTSGRLIRKGSDYYLD